MHEGIKGRIYCLSRILFTSSASPFTVCNMEAPESASQRSYFYVGGVYVDDESNPGERVMQGQMYVEQLTPLRGSRHPFPLVFIHGAGQTASVRFSSGLMFTCKHGLLWNGINVLPSKVTTHNILEIIIPTLDPFLLS